MKKRKISQGFIGISLLTAMLLIQAGTDQHEEVRTADLNNQNYSLNHTSFVLRLNNQVTKEEKLKQEQEFKKQQLAKKQLVSRSSSEPRWSTFTATIYDSNYASTGKRPGHPAYGITASGRKVKNGVTVAVDPNVIPLGSWIEIKYPDGRVEKRRADDTGRLIKGHKLDIYVPDAEVSKFRKGQVKARIISVPK